MNRKLFDKMKAAIRTIIDEEPSLDKKLDVLTDIGLGTAVEETFMASEDVRHEIVEEDNATRIADDVW